MSVEASVSPAAPEVRARRSRNLNPILAKELRGRMRGWRAIILLTVYLFVLCGFSLFIYAVFKEANRLSNPLDTRVGQQLFFGIVTFQTMLVSLLAPAFTAGVITGEREKQTYDVLMITLLKPFSIITGKLGAALAWLLLLVLAVVPLEALAFVFGGVAPEEIVLATVVLMFAALFYGVIGLFWSTITRSTVAATVLSYATLLFLTVGVPLLWGITFALLEATRAGSNAPSLIEQEWFLYTSGVWLSTNPLIAMGISQAFLSEGEPLFFFTTNNMGGGDLFVVHPWLYFCVFATAMSALLTWLSVRALPPVRRRRAPRRPPPAPPALAPAAVGGDLAPPPPPPPAPPAVQIAAEAEQTMARRESEGIADEARLRDGEPPPPETR